MDRIIKTLLAEWKERKLPEVKKREIDLSEYAEMSPAKIIVVTGFRRVGKTYLMLGLLSNLLKEKTRDEAVYINFEDERIPQRTEFLTFLLPSAKQFSDREICFLFLDEIQNIPGWSKWMRRVYDTENIRIFVSGSNSKMSGREIPTELRGRFLEIRVFPLSLREFLDFKGIRFDFKTVEYSENGKAKLYKALNEYLEYGGLPEVVISGMERKNEIAQSYYQTVIRKDIIERYKIKNEEALKAVLRLLLNSTSYSISKLYNTMKSLNYEVGKTTIQKYISYIENSYFLLSVPVFSYNIKNQMQHERKAYFIDNIFISSLSTNFSKNYGRFYENIVAVNLVKKFPEGIYYWKSQQKEEVDFVVRDGLKVKKLIQVCFDVQNIDTKKREIRALLKSSKELKCKSLFVITERYENEEDAEWFGIRRKVKFVPLWKWLLQ